MKTTEPTTTEIPTPAKDFFSSLESLRVTESTAAPLVKSGAGALVLTSASNTFTDLYFNQGALQVANVSMLGSGALKFFGGTLQLGAASAGFTGPAGRRSNTRRSPTVENTRFLCPMSPAVPRR